MIRNLKNLWQVSAQYAIPRTQEEAIPNPLPQTLCRVALKFLRIPEEPCLSFPATNRVLGSLLL